jgi:hypothetical protein
MHEMAEQLLRPVGPILGAQFNISVTSSSAYTDLSVSGDADAAGLVTAIAKGLVLELTADDDIGFLWALATGTVSLAATITAGTAAQMCRRLRAGETLPCVAPAGTQGIICISVVAATILRVTVASRQRTFGHNING